MNSLFTLSLAAFCVVLFTGSTTPDQVPSLLPPKETTSELVSVPESILEGIQDSTKKEAHSKVPEPTTALFIAVFGFAFMLRRRTG